MPEAMLVRKVSAKMYYYRLWYYRIDIEEHKKNSCTNKEKYNDSQGLQLPFDYSNYFLLVYLSLFQNTVYIDFQILCIFLLLGTEIFIVFFYIYLIVPYVPAFLHSFLLLVTVVKGQKPHTYFYSVVLEFFLCPSISIRQYDMHQHFHQ